MPAPLFFPVPPTWSAFLSVFPMANPCHPLGLSSNVISSKSPSLLDHLIEGAPPTPLLDSVSFPSSWELLQSATIDLCVLHVVSTTKFSASWGSGSFYRIYHVIPAPRPPPVPVRCLGYSKHSVTIHPINVWIHKQHKVWFCKQNIPLYCRMLTHRKLSQVPLCWKPPAWVVVLPLC